MFVVGCLLYTIYPNVALGLVAALDRMRAAHEQRYLAYKVVVSLRASNSARFYGNNC